MPGKAEGDSDYVCIHCLRVFTKPSLLTEHITSSHPEKVNR